MDVIVYAHTHWDREWYKSFQTFRLRLIEVFDVIVEQLSSGELTSFYFDGQTIALEDYLKLYPDKKDLIKNLIENKKLYIGPWYVLADEFLVSGESLIRNLMIGINQSKKMGCNDFVGYLPDSFGHIYDMPRILKGFNIDNVVIWRGVGNESSEFVWNSQDGSSVNVVYLVEGYFQDIFHNDISIDKKAKALGKFLDNVKEFNLTETILLPAGGDHLGIVPDLEFQINNINQHIKEYNLKLGSIFDYLNNVFDKNLPLKTINHEFRNPQRNPILPGTLSTRLYLKKENVIATWKLSKLVEPFLAFCEYLQIIKPKRNELEYAWKLLLKNQPHDSICGCSIDSVHRQMLSRFEQVNQISDNLIGNTINKLASNIKEGSIILFNSLNKPYTGVVKVLIKDDLSDNLIGDYITSFKKFPDEIMFNTQVAPVQENWTLYNEYLLWIDNLSPNSLSILDSLHKYTTTPEHVQISNNYISNSHISVNINDNGCITLENFDNALKLSNLHLIYDYADKGDTYNFCPLKSDIPVKANFIGSKIIENNLLRGIVRLYYEIDIPESFDVEQDSRNIVSLNHLIEVDVSLYAGSKHAEFEINWENKSKDHILQLRFEFDENITSTVSENNFGLIKREFNPDYKLQSQPPAPKNAELITNTAPMQRFVWTKGLGIIAEGLTEYGVESNQLYITLLRSVGILSKGKMDVRGVAAGPPIPTSDAQCIGHQQFRYALMLTDNPRDLFEEADKFMGGIITAEAVGEDNCVDRSILGSLFEINDKNIYVYCVKPPFDKNKEGVVVRLMNLSSEKNSVKINCNDKFSSFEEINLNEEFINASKSLNTTIEFAPYELKSLLLK